jgi:hypothetical protein
MAEAIQPAQVWASPKGVMVRVAAVSGPEGYDWIDYRRSFDSGELVPETRTTTTRVSDFRRRFPVLILNPLHK